jgi:ribosomal protein L11
LPIQKSSSPASNADPELDVIEPLLPLLPELDVEGNNVPASPPIAPELPVFPPPAPLLLEDELPVEEQATGKPKAKAPTLKMSQVRFI